MRLARFTPPGSRTVTSGEVVGDEVFAFERGHDVLRCLEHPREAPARGRGHPLGEVTLLEPLAWPRAIFGIGLNYAAHAQEQGKELPERPIVFMKLPSSSAPPNGPLRIPAAAGRRLDYEVELALIMGPGREIAGYAVANDLSARDLQRSEPQWTRAKGFDHSCPWGPWITTADELNDPEALRIRSWVNGELRQDSTTADLVFGPQALVDFVDETCSLEAGDLILTGTPSGVGMSMDPPRFLADGDVVRCEIDGHGAIEHTISVS